MLPKIIDHRDLDAHADDPRRVSPRTLDRYRADYEERTELESRRFGDAYRERVKAKITRPSGPPDDTQAEPHRSLMITTDERFWKPAKLG